MTQLKGRLQLAKFRIKQNPITLVFLISSIVLDILSLVELAHKNLSSFFPIAVISIICSVWCIRILKDITRKNQVKINEIKLKYGIRVKVEFNKEVK